jgi:NADH:ubiquinone oxidoreductase subunit 2 (subunit N)
VISLWYYIGIVRQMYFVEVPEIRPLRVSPAVTGVALVAAIGVLGIFIYVDLFARFAQGAVLP